METITIISTVPIISMFIWFVNIFIDFFISFLLRGIVVSMRINGIMIIFLVFFIFLSSFGAIDAVYINRVIIPDENVMITTKDNHLDMVTLNKM